MTREQPERLTTERLTTEQAASLLTQLQESAREIAALSDERLLAGWAASLDLLRQRIFGPALARLAESHQLSPQGFARGLEILIEGSSPTVARNLLTRATSTPSAPPARAPMAVLLTSTPPGLALQVLLPALVRRRPLLLKPSSRDRTMTRLIVECLHIALPETSRAFVVADWAGGDQEIEDIVLDRVERIVAYGRGETLERLRQRYGNRLVAHGPKVSVALVTKDRPLAAVAGGLARDIALFDQRGCLSLQWIFTEHPLEAFATALGSSLVDLASVLPAGPLDRGLAASIQAVRATALMQGRLVKPAPVQALEIGTVIGERVAQRAEIELRPSPGGRTVWLYQVADIESAARRLADCAGLLQGVVLEGRRALEQRQRLLEAGVSHLASAGALQLVDAGWKNGGLDPLEVY